MNQFPPTYNQLLLNRLNKLLFKYQQYQSININTLIQQILSLFNSIYKSTDTIDTIKQDNTKLINFILLLQDHTFYLIDFEREYINTL